MCLTYPVSTNQVLDFLPTKQPYHISFVKNTKKCAVGNHYTFRETFYYTGVSSSYVI